MCSDVSQPHSVVATTLVFQLLLNFSTVVDYQTESLCEIIISSQSIKVYLVVRLLDVIRPN